MPALVLHPRTAEAIERFVRNPGHALIIAGASGSGKKALSRLLEQRLLGLEDVAQLEQYPYRYIVAPPADKASIGIDEVRELHTFAKLKLPQSEGRNRRLLIIHDAHGMTTEAQNAILKLLEEPPLNTTLILTVAEEDALLPTIRSRAQKLQVYRPTREALDYFFTEQGHDQPAISQAYMLSGGLPGLQHALLQDDEHPLKQAVQTARTLLQADAFARLCLVDELSKKRPECLQLLFVLQHMAQAAIEQASGQAGQQPPDAIYKRLVQWQRILKASYRADQALRQNAQAKLVLDNLMLSL